MLVLSNQQLQSAIAQLDQAIYHHEQWHRGLMRVLIAHAQPDAVDLMPDAHHRCRFGQWYHSQHAETLRQHAAFVAIGHAHEIMHSLARGLLMRSVEGAGITPDEWDPFSHALDRMRLEVQSLRHDLADMDQHRDPLTGARNRATLLSDLREKHAMVCRGGHSCAIAMADLDDFKLINDHHGHAAGDKVLVVTVQCMQSVMRSYDRIYRYGGEEFLLSMPDTTFSTALSLVERLREAVAAMSIPCDDAGHSLRVTGSFGVALLSASRSVEDSIDRADKAMYQAKGAGRNRVVGDG